MRVRELKQLLKGIDNAVDIYSGNYTAYHPQLSTFKDTLHILLQTGARLNEIKPKEVKTVVLWCEE